MNYEKEFKVTAKEVKREVYQIKYEKSLERQGKRVKIK